MIGVYCSPARISSHLNCRCNHRGKERRRVWVQAGRRDNWWTETSCVLIFFFFCMEEKAFEKSNGWDCCLQKGKKILWESCTCSGGSPLFWLYYNYYLILYSSNGKHKKKRKEKICSNSNACLPCLPCSSFCSISNARHSERDGGAGQTRLQTDSFWHKQS